MALETMYVHEYKVQHTYNLIYRIWNGCCSHYHVSALCSSGQHTYRPTAGLRASNYGQNPCEGSRTHTDAGRERTRQGSALFKLVTQKRVIISTQERGRGERGRERSDRIPSSFLLLPPFFLSICKSGGLTPDKIGPTERERQRRERERHGGTTKQLSPPLADIYTALLSFFPPPHHVMSSVRLPFPPFFWSWFVGLFTVS